jgi:Cu2+-exporting ATPase
MVKAPDGLERIAEIDMIVFDKTGTLTLGKPQLVKDESISDEALAAAGSLAAGSRHPYARALVTAAERRFGSVQAAASVEESPGEGLKRIGPSGEERLGSASWCRLDRGGEGAEVWYRRGDEAPVRFRFEDAIRPDAAETVTELKRRGYGVALLSGDRVGIVERTARAAGIESWQAAQKPKDKIAWLKARGEEGRKVLMVGDGLNDAPALAAAYASISPASGADISQRAADFVFQGARLAPVVEAIETGRRARALAFQNFGVAGIYNVICIPFAVAGFVTPLIAAIVMSTSSILVTLNAARLARGKRA